MRSQQLILCRFTTLKNQCRREIKKKQMSSFNKIKWPKFSKLNGMMMMMEWNGIQFKRVQLHGSIISYLLVNIVCIKCSKKYLINLITKTKLWRKNQTRMSIKCLASFTNGAAVVSKPHTVTASDADSNV